MVAYFYFEFSDTEKQSHDHLTRSLIMQLSAQSMSTLKALEELFTHHQNGNQNPSTKGLVATLKEIINSSQQTYIILDALDECKERKELLLLIKEMTEWNMGKLYILATSRKEKDIEESLEPLGHRPNLHSEWAGPS